MQLHQLDWIIICLYLIGMIALSIFISRGQKNKGDYYLGGNDTGAWPIAISTMATQCSTNSILGAPAFVAFSIGGGLVWLQYELAVPFAMIFLMIFLLPIYRKLGIISVYAYLEQRFDKNTRMLLSVLFQFIRAFATSTIVYGTSLVISYCTGLSFTTAVLVLAVVTIIYDSIGGMKAVIYSDVIQMIVLYGSILAVLYYLLQITGGMAEVVQTVSAERIKAINFDSLGFDGESYAFFPMLIGGFFLYVSYYGCDQSQVQRELSTKSIDDTNWSLFINGILRFPLVLTYCILGLCLGAYAIQHPEFLQLLPLENGSPNYNLAVPVFVIKYFPIGMVGLVMVGLFSAAMSSLDSTINSLSATSMQDIFKSYLGKSMSNENELWLSKGLTVFWGTVCTIFAFFVGDISDSIIISINKIGSLANGPILGVFLLGIFTTRANGFGAIFGLFLGFLVNLSFWLFLPQVTWPWWNMIGCIVCVVVGYIVSLVKKSDSQKDLTGLTYLSFKSFNKDSFKVNWTKYYWILAAWGLAISLLLYYIKEVLV